MTARACPITIRLFLIMDQSECFDFLYTNTIVQWKSTRQIGTFNICWRHHRVFLLRFFVRLCGLYLFVFLSHGVNKDDNHWFFRWFLRVLLPARKLCVTADFSSCCCYSYYLTNMDIEGSHFSLKIFDGFRSLSKEKTRSNIYD